MLDDRTDGQSPPGAEAETRHPAGRAVWPVLVGVFALALAVRVGYMSQVRASPLFDVHQGDARWHAEWATRIADGTFTDGRPFFRAPLYPFFLAGVYRLSGESFLAAKVLQHVLGAASCVLLFLLARRAFSTTTALIASLLAALYGPLMYFEKELLIPPLAVFLMLGMLLAVARAVERPTGTRWLVAGLLLGLCGITRPNFLLFAPVLLAWLVMSARREPRPASGWLRAATLAAGIIIPVAPVTLHNLLVGRDFVLIASQWGINFEIGNNPLADGKTAAAPAWLARRPQDGYMDNVYAASRQVAEADLGRPAKDSQIAGYWLRRGLGFLRTQPADAARLYAKKVYYLLNGFEIESNRSMYLDRTWSPIFAALVWVRGLAVPFGLVGPLALVGLALPGADRRVGTVLKLFALTYALSVVAFFVTGRFRIPLVPIACIFAGHTLHRLFTAAALRQWRLLAVGTPASLILIVFCNTAWFGVRSVDRSRQAWIVGSALAQDGRLDDAVEQFERALAIEPDNRRTLTDLGGMLLRRRSDGDISRAAAAFQRALSANPRDVQALLGLGMVHILRDGPAGYDQARSLFDAALRIAPDHAPALVYVGDLLLRENKLDQAIATLQEAISRDPSYAAGRVTLARAYDAAGRPEAAAEQYAEALRLNPDEPYCHYRFGALLLADGDLHAAVAHLRHATRTDPSLARAWYLLGNALLQFGKQDEAMSAFEQAVTHQPDLADARNNLAVILAHKGQIEGAISHLQRALQAAPDDAEVRTNLAAMLRRQRRWAEAIALVEDGLTRMPDSADLALDLAWMLATCPVDSFRDGPRAVSLAERHITDTPGDPRALDVLAAAYAEVGRFGEGAAAAEQAASLAVARGQHSFARQIAARAAGYRQRQPFRQER